MNRVTGFPHAILVGALIVCEVGAGCVRAQIAAPVSGVVGQPATTLLVERDATGQPAQVSFPDGNGGTTQCVTPCRVQTASGPRPVTVQPADGSTRTFVVDVPPGQSQFALSYRNRGASVAYFVLGALGLVGSSVCGIIAPQSGLVPVVSICGTSVVLLSASLIARGVAGDDYADYVAAGPVAARRGAPIRFAGAGIMPTTAGGLHGTVALQF